MNSAYNGETMEHEMLYRELSTTRGRNFSVF
jgi:hypothetical protein